MIRVLDKKRNPAGWPVEIKQMQLTIPRRCCILLPKQLTPRKGTETAWSRPCSPCPGKQLTPRKGTVTPSTRANLASTIETTHTPQGDGNMVRVIMGFLAIVLKHITPRKGTVTRPAPCMCPRRSHETTYTPQGDDPLERRDPHEPANRTSHLRLSAP